LLTGRCRTWGRRAARGIPTVRRRPVAPRGRRWDTHDQPIQGEKNGTADHRESTRQANVYAYDVESDANEVDQSLLDIFAQYKMKMNVWVISGTHGTHAAAIVATARRPLGQR